MDDRDRLHAYLIIRNLRTCTAEAVAHLTGLSENQVERVLGELVGENIAVEFTRGSQTTYTISESQENALARKAADLVVRLRGVT